MLDYHASSGPRFVEVALMSSFVRNTGLLLAFLALPAGASAATPKEIDAAIKKGAEALKAKYTRGAGLPVGIGENGFGIGPSCLAGLAILEAGTPGNDPAVKTITETIRSAAYTQVKTYQIALCLIYLDRYGDPADEPLIQALGARLLVAQTANGGWGYECISAVSAADVERLKAIKPGQAGKLNPEVEKYGQALTAAHNPSMTGDDNSNTQFAILAIWLSRKHGVPVETALDLIEKRFLVSQNSRTGSWSYSGPLIQGGGPNVMPVDGSSPAMYCAGLLGLSTGIARHEEARQKHDAPKPEPKVNPAVEPKKNPDDPFFTPPPKAGGTTEPKKPAPRPQTATERASQFALTGLGSYVSELSKAGRGALAIKEGGPHGHGDLYFLWSLERVGVIYGLDKIGGIDWYEAGAQTLVSSQNQDGSWGTGVGFGTEVNTSFAVLFLCRSNLARDLAGKVSKETNTEMKFGGGTGGSTETKKPGDPITTKPDPVTPPPFLPGAAGNEAATLSAELTRAADKDWKTMLGKLRDTKGTVYTQALVGAVYRLEGDRRKDAREALAERLTRMTADTLRTMSTGDDIELRRASVLAMAMKDDKAHIPDLVAALSDDEDIVIRAARAGLKSLTGEDFGPAPNASRNEKTIATESWKQWMSKQKK
jgi:hypothetical protein